VKGAIAPRNRRTNMKVERAKRVASKAIEELSQALERGHSEKLKEYLAAVARFHRYSLYNVMLIASQRPDATRVAGYQTWRQFGRYVKKGAKGIFILAPILAKKGAEQVSPEEECPNLVVALNRARFYGPRLTFCENRYSE